jgi:PAS domain S-box-containing protein
MRRFQWRWIVLAVVLLSGFSMTYVAGQNLQKDALRSWQAEARQAAVWLSGTVLSWLEESYAPVSALAMLFENSAQVSEAQFLGAVDTLESRATAYFIDAVMVLRRRADGPGWRVQFSSDPRGPLPADAMIGELPTLDVARQREGQMILGPSVALSGTTRASLVAFATRDANGPLMILALINFDSILSSLFELNSEDGLQVMIAGQFPGTDAPGAQQVVFGASVADAMHSVSTRTVSAAADLTITWYMDSTFRMGPNIANAQSTRIFGYTSSLLVSLFLAWFMWQNRIVERKIEVATAELSKKEQQFRELLESAPDAMVVVDESGTILMINREGEQLFGYQREEILGSAVESLMPQRLRAGHPAQRRRYTDDPFIRAMGADLELLALTKSGEEVPIEVALSPIETDEGMMVVVSLRDITERKQADDEIKRTNAELAQARKAADEANDAKSNFLANMSHEIRTPMNAIIGMSYLCLQTELDSKQRNYVEKVQRSAESLLGVINDILDFSKIEAGKLDMEAIDFHLEDVFANLVNLVGLRAQEKGLELLFDIQPQIPMALVGDPLRLGQVLLNLANNAVKFTEQGEIVVGVEALNVSETHAKLRFRVRDTGVGLQEEHRARLFESFSQADTSTTRKYGGTGLGLAISKRLVELMDGEIWADSEPGVGSTFFFTANFARQAVQQPLAEPADLAELNGMRVLAVDDNATAREILYGILDSLRFRVDVAASGEEALRAIAAADRDADPFALVLMDWKMPRQDGLATLCSLRELDELQAVPRVLMVTAFGKEELMDEARDIELDGVLIKPVSPSTLNDSIASLFGRRSSESSRGAVREAEKTAAHRHLMGARILLVEDNETNQEIALELLSLAGMVVEVANNGQEALSLLQTQSFDGVLMDMQMPVMDGVTATVEIRRQSQFATLPVIAMTANAMAGDRDRCLQAGMNDHIAKPINVDNMFNTMAKWITPKEPARDRLDEQAQRSARALPQSLPVLDGLDTQTGLANVVGNEQLYARLLRRFAEEQSTFTQRLQQCLDSGDGEQATRLAHTLKGVAASLGAGAIAAAAGELELACRNGEGDAQCVELLARVDDVLAPLLVALGPWLMEVPPSQALSAAPGTVDFIPILDRLQVLLESYDAEANDVIEELEQALAAGPHNSDSRRLRKLVDDFEFDAALEVVAAIRRDAQES